MLGGFRHKGLEELHLTGKTCRIGAGYVRKCVRILQLLEVAAQPEDLNIAGFRFHALRGNPQRWSLRVTGNYRITQSRSATTFDTYRITAIKLY